MHVVRAVVMHALQLLLNSNELYTSLSVRICFLEASIKWLSCVHGWKNKIINFQFSSLKRILYI